LNILINSSLTGGALNREKEDTFLCSSAAGKGSAWSGYKRDGKTRFPPRGRWTRVRAAILLENRSPEGGKQKKEAGVLLAKGAGKLGH